MNLSGRRLGAAYVISVDEPRIDAAVAIQFKDQMRALTAASTGRVVLDLSGVSFVDSSGLGAIVASMKQMDTGQTLELAGLMPNVQKVFELTRMDTVFRIHGDIDAALGRRAG